MPPPEAERRSGLRWRYWLTAFILLAFIAASVGCTGFIRDRLYEPREGLAAIPEWIGTPPRQIAVTTEDGLRLAGYYWPPARGEHDIILVLHGRRDNYRRMAGYVERLTESGRGVLIASYRGFNENPGQPSETGLITDAESFYRFARSQAGREGQVYLFGHSLGGAVAIQLAAREALDGVITLGTFADIDEAVPLYGEWLISDKWRSNEAIADVAEPILFLHGAIDNRVTPNQSEELYARACSPASLLLLDGLKHRPNIHIIAPLINGWFDAIENSNVAGWRPTIEARKESKPACIAR